MSRRASQDQVPPAWASACPSNARRIRPPICHVAFCLPPTASWHGPLLSLRPSHVPLSRGNMRGPNGPRQLDGSVVHLPPGGSISCLAPCRVLGPRHRTCTSLNPVQRHYHSEGQRVGLK